MKRVRSQDDKFFYNGQTNTKNKLKNDLKLQDIDIFKQFDKRDQFQAKRTQSTNFQIGINQYNKQHKSNRHYQTKHNKSRPFFLQRAVYAIGLLGFMMIICFYYDLLQNYNFLSLVLGLVACIIFQVKVLQYIFKRQMYKMQIDEYGALRSKIKYLFGELNSNYLDQKNRKKYYHHILSTEDKLFDKQNQDIYNNTMQYLISKSKFNHIENIQKINRKWQIIITKYQIMKNFVNNFMTIHSARAKIFTSFIQKINNTFTQNDYQIWQKVLQTHQNQKDQQNKNTYQGIYRFLGTKKPLNEQVQNSKTKQKDNDFTDLSMSQDGLSISQNNTFVSSDFKKQFMDLKKQSQHPLKQAKDLLSWKQIISFLQYRNRINIKKQTYMKQSVLDQLKLTSQQAKSQRQFNIKQLDILKNKYQQNVKIKLQIQNQIHKLKQKIYQLSSIILTKKRTTQNNQQICKMELDIRIKKVQIENFQVKLAFHQDLIKRNVFELYLKCRDINKQLQTRTLPLFNNKLSNYINMLLEYQKKYSKHISTLINQYQDKKLPNQKQFIKSASLLDQFKFLNGEFELSQQMINNYSFSQLYQLFRIRSKSQQNMKIFFQQMKRFYRQICLHLDKTVQMIEKVQTQLFQKANQSINPNPRNINFSTNKDKLNDQDSLPSLTTNYTANLFYDRYFLNILASLSRKDEKIFNQSVKILQKQSQLVNQYLDNSCQPSVLIIQKIVQKYNKTDQQMKKLQKSKSKTINLDQYSIKLNEYQSLISQVKKQLYWQIKKKQKYFVHSVINQLTKQMIQKHYKIYQYILIHEKKSFHFQPPTQKQQEQQNRNIKFKEYQLYVLKVQKNNFNDPLYQSLSRNNQNRNQTKKKPLVSDNTFKTNILASKTEKNPQNILKEKHFQSKQESLRILNKLLGVLFQEWSNSQFFHDLIKQQLQISLNFKRPGIVQPLRISHLKVQQKTKQSGFQDLIPHSSQMYRCLFDVKINFKGKIAVHISSRLNFGNRTPLNIQLLIKQFKCPLRVCFNPFSIGKCYVSLLQRPFLNIEYDVKLGDWHINRIPFFSQIIKIFIVIKLRKKMLWPKKITLSIPLAYKNPLGVAIRQRILFQNQRRKTKMN